MTNVNNKIKLAYVTGYKDNLIMIEQLPIRIECQLEYILMRVPMSEFF